MNLSTHIHLLLMFKMRGAEDGHSIFLRNVGIYLRVYTTPKPRTTTYHLHSCEHLKSHNDMIVYIDILTLHCCKD
jgi:hypothetical protein